MPRVRLDKLLVDRGLSASRERARELVAAGSVTVNGFPARKAGTQVERSADVKVVEEDHAYVSRGALKLERALDEFSLDPAGWVALDVGASTGGFTDVLLRRGAKRVYAIDVGYGQLAWRLRQDDRVVVLERENIRYLDPHKIPEPADFAAIDVSFISLSLVLPKVAELLGPPGGKPIACLVKPQFEVGKADVGRGGVVRDEAARRGALDKVRRAAREAGLSAEAWAESPIRGPAGNIEYLLLLRSPA